MSAALTTLKLSNNWNIIKTSITLAFKSTKIALLLQCNHESFYYIFIITTTIGGSGDYYYVRINNFLLMCWGWGLLMADYLFWHRANTENSGFFRENRYLDQERERERAKERTRGKEGKWGWPSPPLSLSLEASCRTSSQVRHPSCQWQ